MADTKNYKASANANDNQQTNLTSPECLRQPVERKLCFNASSVDGEVSSTLQKKPDR